MKSVMLSIQPKWCELIASGKKTIEVRKMRPQIETPFKCYIYCTASDVHSCLVVGGGSAELFHCCNYKTAFVSGGVVGNGKVIGEFVCDRIYEIEPYNTFDAYGWNFDFNIQDTCLSENELEKYLLRKNKEISIAERGYGWHITDLKIYDKPKELWEFNYLCTGKECSKCQYEVREELPFGKIGVCCGRYHITRPFQSWGYVEELSE